MSRSGGTARPVYGRETTAEESAAALWRQSLQLLRELGVGETVIAVG